MLAVQRHALIRDAVRAAGVVGTDELARQLGVSIETVRRDLLALERAGQVQRVHGGAAALDAPLHHEEPSFSERAGLATAAKRTIAARALALVEEGMTIVIDVGTTALEVARALPGSLRATVATCSLLVAAELAGRERLDVLVSGGRVRAGDLALSDAQTIAFFADLNADVAFLGSGGVDADAGLSDFHRDEVATRRTMIAHAARSYVLAERAKLGRIAPHRVCAINEVTGVITDARVPARARAAFTRAGTAVLDR